jgi:hypothetical protein
VCSSEVEHVQFERSRVPASGPQKKKEIILIPRSVDSRWGRHHLNVIQAWEETCTGNLLEHP